MCTRCVGINSEITLRVQEVALIRNKDISIINHYARSSQPDFSRVYRVLDVAGPRRGDWVWASRSITAKIVLDRISYALHTDCPSILCSPRLRLCVVDHAQKFCIAKAADVIYRLRDFGWGEDAGKRDTVRSGTKCNFSRSVQQKRCHRSCEFCTTRNRDNDLT